MSVEHDASELQALSEQVAAQLAEQSDEITVASNSPTDFVDTTSVFRDHCFTGPFPTGCTILSPRPQAADCRRSRVTENQQPHHLGRAPASRTALR